MNDSGEQPQLAAFGLLSRKPRWSLSAKGWFIFLGASALLLVLGIRSIHGFLAVNSPVDSQLLVVEGWIQNSAIRAAVVEFTNGRYTRVFSTGGPVRGTSGYINDFNTAASVGGDQLKAAGLPPSVLEVVPSRVKDRDRTYGAAMALRQWFQTNNIAADRFNVLTESVHARRTRLLYRKAFPDAEIGIISIPNPEYPADRWWRYSEGVKEVIAEGGAYLYARFLFHP